MAWTKKTTSSATWDQTNFSEGSFMLMEDEDFLLMEDGDRIIILPEHSDWTKRTPGNAIWT